MKYIDVHSHWADLRLNPDNEILKNRLKSCLSKNIDFCLQAGVNPNDWKRQIEIQKMFPKNFGLCFGLHPYYVSDSTSEECEVALDQLARYLPQAMALGEAGLDFRPHIMKESEGLQIEIFENQIELAKVFQKPMVLHVVQAHDKVLQIFNIWGAPNRSGFVHAFNGSYETAIKYINKGFLISIGGAVTYSKNRKLQSCIKKMPLEYLLIESDSPDQPPFGWVGVNESISIYNVAEKIAFLRGTNIFEILEINSSNFKRLFKV